MSVPSRRESAVLLLSLEPPAWHLRHSRAVAETAAWLAWRAASAGVSLDRRLVESAALLHDIDKLQRVEPETAGLAHGEGSADWLARRGYRRAWTGDRRAPRDEARRHDLVRALAGRRRRPRRSSSPMPTSAPDRVSSRWPRVSPHGRRRYPPQDRAGRARGEWTSETLVAVWRRAETLELRVCELAGVTPRRFVACRGRGAPSEPREAPDVAAGPTAPLGYYWGDDSYSVGHGPDALAARLAGDGPPLERMRLTGAATTADEIIERVATSTLFGGGTLVVVADPAPLIATKPLAVRSGRDARRRRPRQRSGLPRRGRRNSTPPGVAGGAAQCRGRGRRRSPRVQGADPRSDGPLDRGSGQGT